MRAASAGAWRAVAWQSLDPQIVDAVWQAGHAIHPTVDLPRERLGEYLGTRTWDGTPARAADLYLAAACLAGLPQATECFAATYLGRIPRYLGKLATSVDFVDEVKQRLAVLLFVGDGDQPLLASYTGLGPLEGWLRVTAMRLGLRLRRGDARRDNWERRAAAPVLDRDPELALLKQAYREPVLRCFVAAVSALPTEQRLLLRLHYVEGMTTAALATLHRIGRATVVRRLADARAAVLAATLERLGTTLGAATEELESVLRLVRSQLEVSLTDLLADIPPMADGSR